MPKHDPRVDAYLKKAPAYARPILTKLRAVLHAADPAATEDLKWGAPTIMHDGMVCSFVAFKKHVGLWFHKGALLDDRAGLLKPGKTVAMRAAHFTDEKQISARPIAALVKQAVKLNQTGVKAPKRPESAKRFTVPTDLRSALGANARAKAFYASLSPSHQREYAEWIVEAKRAETRERRIAQAIEMLAKGERRNEKYSRPAKKKAATKPRATVPRHAAPKRRATAARRSLSRG